LIQNSKSGGHDNHPQSCEGEALEDGQINREMDTLGRGMGALGARSSTARAVEKSTTPVCYGPDIVESNNGG